MKYFVNKLCDKYLIKGIWTIVNYLCGCEFLVLLSKKKKNWKIDFFLKTWSLPFFFFLFPFFSFPFLPSSFCQLLPAQNQPNTTSPPPITQLLATAPFSSSFSCNSSSSSRGTQGSSSGTQSSRQSVEQQELAGDLLFPATSGSQSVEGRLRDNIT